MSMDLHINAVRKCFTFDRKGKKVETKQEIPICLNKTISGSEARHIIEESEKGKDALLAAIIAHYDEHSYIYEREEIDFPKDWDDQKKYDYVIWDSFNGLRSGNSHNFKKLPIVLVCTRKEIVNELTEKINNFYKEGFDFDAFVL